MPSPGQLLHDPRWQGLWQALLLACAAISAYYAFTPAPPPLSPSLGDKVNHLAAFSAMGFAAALSRLPGRRHTWTVAFGLFGYGALIEIVQAALPPRHADFADLLADVVGCGFGLLLAAALRRLWRPTGGVGG